MTNPTNDEIARLAPKEFVVRHTPECKRFGKIEVRIALQKTVINVIIFCPACGILEIIPDA